MAVIVVHWANNMEDTVECLESLSQVDYPSLTIVLVNNGSRNFDEDRVRQTFPEVLIVSSSENLGFAGGSNLGISRVLGEGSDLIMLLNNDTVVSRDLVWSLLPAMDDPQVGIVGPVITYYGYPDKVWDAGGSYSRLLGYAHRRRPLACADQDRRVDYVSGCALMAKREVFETVGMLWDALFLYGEEAEFCLRAAKANYRSVLVGKPLIRHKISASAGKRGTNQLTSDQAYYFARNPFLVLRRHTTGLTAVSGVVSQFIIVFPYQLLRCVASRDVTAIGSLLGGMLDGMRGRSGKRPTCVRTGAK